MERGSDQQGAGAGNQQGRRPVTDEIRRQRHESRVTNTYKQFLDRLGRFCDLPREELEGAAVSVTCALEQRLTGDEAFDFEAQLPWKLRELLTRCPQHEGAPPRKFGQDEFYGMISQDLGKTREQAISIARAVFLALKGAITQGEVDDIASQLPSDLKEIWLYP